MKAILSRHSVRRYSDKEIPESQLMEILHAGMSALSAMGSRPWHFILVTDRERLEGVAEIHPYAQMSKQASAGILVCGEPSKETFEMYFQQNCSAAVENILIAVSSFGLGSVWVGWYPNATHVKNFKEYFKLPEGIEPFAWVPIGHLLEPARPDNRLDLTMVHRNIW